MKSEGRIEEIIWSKLSKRTGGRKETIWKQLGRSIYSNKLIRRIWKQLGRRIITHLNRLTHPNHPEEVIEHLIKSIWKQLCRRIPTHPTHRPHPEEIKEQVSRRVWKQLSRSILPHPTHPTHPLHPEKVNKKLVIFHVMSELGLKRGRKRKMSI